MRRAEQAREILDGAVPAADLAATLADLDRFNAWFGGYRLTLQSLHGIARRVAVGRRLVVADVGGGRGDFATRLVGWARRARRPIRVVVVDRDAVALGLATAARRDCAEILLVQADATALPLRERSVDVVTTTLTLHHLEPAAALTALAEMGAAARHAVVVNDLLRTRLSLALVWLATRLLRAHPMSRHDGPLSVRRAYSADELRALAETAGLTWQTGGRHRLWARLVAVLA